MNVNEHFIVRSITKKLEFLEVPYIILHSTQEREWGEACYSTPFSKMALIAVTSAELQSIS
jgi:hypothetical protein